MGLESRFFRNPEVAAHRVDEETILAPRGRRPGESVFFTLNELGTFVWERLDGQRSLSSIADDIVFVYAVEASRAAADVLEFVGELERAGCVLEVGPWSFDSGGSSRFRDEAGSPAPHPGVVDLRRGVRRAHPAPQSALFPRRLPN